MNDEVLTISYYNQVLTVYKRMRPRAMSASFLIYVSSWISKKIAPHRGMKYYLFELLFDDLSCFIKSANFTHSVTQFQLSALLTFHHTRHSQFKMCTALVTTSLGCSTLWYCHVSHLLQKIRLGSLLKLSNLLILKQILQRGQPRINTLLRASAVSLI